MTLRCAVAPFLLLVSFGILSCRAGQADESEDIAFASLSRPEQDAITTLRKIGAIVRVTGRSTESGNETRKGPPTITVVIGKQWTGSDDDLKHAQDLSTLGALYVIGTERVTDKAIEKLRKSRPKVNIERLPEAQLGVIGMPHPKGFEITKVAADSAADRAGIRVEDVLVEFAGNPVPSIEALKRLMLPLKPRQEVTAKLLRDGETLSVIVMLHEWKN